MAFFGVHDEKHTSAFFRQLMRHWQVVCSSLVMAHVVEVVVLVAAKSECSKMLNLMRKKSSPTNEYLEFPLSDKGNFISRRNIAPASVLYRLEI